MRRRTTPFASSSSSSGGSGGGVVSAPAEPGRATSEIEQIEPFPRFDAVSDDSDHFYRNPRQTIPASTQKNIMHEWKLLEQHLPESITVRAYEKRIDLLRAAIVGAATTPYHDGLYFFDISFPPNYPAQPPQVHYRSFGYRINPNLYASGAVCLSLLNTWGGNFLERWNPKESTILQLLLSIQALVLNEKPYYNEPGSGIFKILGPYGEKSSFAYNEATFVLSCKSMLRLLSRPPRGFEVLVVGHFRDRARAILQACRAYADGRVWVGYFLEGNPPQQGPSSRVAVSQKFKESMRSLYPQLFEAFSKEGASLAGLHKELSGDLPLAPGKKGLWPISLKWLRTCWN
ncbi:putative ubiquitin-conjugating enzyme E2 38 [Eucalyptus grandis]|uniref:putative ubiquitin-conjugating enzyme E2 38 n=1 Tax=Eucalyptus grandis TaxID=71139 RepID=UPI00192EA1D4|nr:putative ubiquitin-conjugating enzyme E2 38 [Eucalyptus grandis]